MVDPNIESKEAGLPSEIARTGKWLRPSAPGPEVCIKTAKKSLITQHLGDWARISSKFFRFHRCFLEPYSFLFENGLDKTLIIFSLYSVSQIVSTVDFSDNIFMLV